MYLNAIKEVNNMNTSYITNYKPKDFAELLGISVKTLQRWDRGRNPESKVYSNKQTLLYL